MIEKLTEEEKRNVLKDTKPELLNKSRSRKIVGDIGELLFSKFLRSKGLEFEQSPDPFDNKKDFYVKNKSNKKLKIEVKTQVPFMKNNGFSFREKQLKKCESVDCLIFISVPIKNRHHFSFGKMYKIRPKDMEYSYYSQYMNGEGDVPMVLIPINQEKMEEIDEISEEDIKLLEQYSITDM